MARMRVVQVGKAKGPLELVEREIPEPGAGQVRIKVQACGVCHSDVYTKEGLFPGIDYPRVPGHEVAGIVDALGAGVAGWRVGERAGVGWHDEVAQGRCQWAGVSGANRRINSGSASRTLDHVSQRYWGGVCGVLDHVGHVRRRAGVRRPGRFGGRLSPMRL